MASIPVDQEQTFGPFLRISKNRLDSRHFFICRYKNSSEILHIMCRNWHDILFLLYLIKLLKEFTLTGLYFQSFRLENTLKTWFWSSRCFWRVTISRIFLPLLLSSCRAASRFSQVINGTLLNVFRKTSKYWVATSARREWLCWKKFVQLSVLLLSWIQLVNKIRK